MDPNTYILSSEKATPLDSIKPQKNNHLVKEREMYDYPIIQHYGYKLYKPFYPINHVSYLVSPKAVKAIIKTQGKE